MVDVFKKEKRSWVMSRIRSSGTKPEKAFLRIIRVVFAVKKYPRRKHSKKLPGRPDVIFFKHKVAVFVDGDFWHGYRYKKWLNRLPKKYWREKIKNNIERDRKTNRMLRKLGWSVVRIWEHDLKNAETVLQKMAHALGKK